MFKPDYFTVISNDADLTLRVKDFSTPSVAPSLLSTSYLHVGYYKPFRQFYLEIEEPETTAKELTFEYFNGSTWVVIPDLVDETLGLTKSGFVYFNRQLAWKKTTVASKEEYFIRIKPDSDLNASFKIVGLNVLFSNDDDLIAVKSNIVSKFNNGASWVTKHEVARKDIIQTLRNAGNVKIKDKQSNTALFFGRDREDVDTYSDITALDLLEPFQLREASKYLTLGMIYLNELSDEEGDKYEVAGNRYMAKGYELADLFRLSLDVDDDGEADDDENLGSARVDLSWT